MQTKKLSWRTCKNGHHYTKSSDCPVCPICETKRKPSEGILSHLPAPARRALENSNITTAAQLSSYREADILALHAVGISAIIKLRKALAKENLSFKV